AGKPGEIQYVVSMEGLLNPRRINGFGICQCARGTHFISFWNNHGNIIIPPIREVFPHFEVGEKVPSFIIIHGSFWKPLRQCEKVRTPASPGENIWNF